MFVYLDEHSECDWDNVLKLNYPRSSVSVSKKYRIESLYLLKRKKVRVNSWKRPKIKKAGVFCCLDALQCLTSSQIDRTPVPGIFSIHIFSALIKNNFLKLWNKIELPCQRLFTFLQTYRVPSAYKMSTEVLNIVL